jgi:hypothetical protein
MDRFDKLLATPEPPELGPGPRPGVLSEAELDRNLEGLVTPLRIPGNKKQLVRALVLLWHDHLETAHGIAQDIDDADGAFVHGIMHRREPDYGNAKYWFRRVGTHAIFPELAKRASALLAPAPFGFVDACQQAAKPSAEAEQVKLLREVQRVETEVLLEYLCA